MARFLKLSEAVEEVVRDGDTAAFEGFTHLIPTPPATRPFASAARS